MIKISFLLSGGINNTHPNKSLGGAISKQDIGSEINNLFSDVTNVHSGSGYTDYRCIYVKNDNQNEKLVDVSLYVHKDLSGSEVMLGLALTSDVQALMVAGNPINGSFQLQYTLKHAGLIYTQTTRTINWQPDAKLMSQRIAAVLNSLDFLSGVQCVGNNNGSGYDFLVTFAGESTGRLQELLAVINEEGLQVAVMSVTKGGPINSVAPNISVPNNQPNGVIFFATDNITPVLVGTLFPNDFMPIWFQRVVAKNTTPVHPDLFKLHLFGDTQPITIKSNTSPDTTKKSKKMHF